MPKSYCLNHYDFRLVVFYTGYVKIRKITRLYHYVTNILNIVKHVAFCLKLIVIKLL